MTLEAEFDVPAERVWQLWEDPRQLEQWWGPPTYPATVTSHDLRPGGRVEYHMTGPEGDQSKGYWEILEAEPPHRLVFNDGFANAGWHPEHRPATQLRPSGHRGHRRRAHPDVDPEHLPQYRGNGAGSGHGHGGRPEAGCRPDRRHPRGVRRKSTVTIGSRRTCRRQRAADCGDPR